MKLSKLLLLRPLADRASGRRKNADVTGKKVPVETRRKRKREDAESVSCSCVKRIKQCEIVKMVEETDRDFTDLPEQVIHHILSLLHPNEAARLCVLSKRWNSMWNSFPVLDFDERYFKKLGKAWETKMLTAVDQSLQNRLQQDLTIEKFRLSFGCPRFFQYFMDNLVTTAIDLKVKNLEVVVKSVKRDNVFKVPSTVLSAGSIVVLNLFGCKVDISDSDCVKLPRLRKLSLRRLPICEKMLQKLIAGCPFIQDLRIVQCSKLEEIVVSTAPLLKRIDVYMCLRLKSINVNAPTLRSFCFIAIGGQLCNLKLSECRLVKKLVLEYPIMSDEMFEQDIAQFPNLEKLSLLNCGNIKKIHIPCEKLQTLVIMKCIRLLEAVIYAERLSSLEYKGSGMPINLLYPSSLKDVKLFFNSLPKGRVRCPHQERSDENKLKDLFQNLDRSKGLKMISRHNSGLILQEDIVGKPHISNSIAGLQLQISRRVGKLIDNFLRDARRVEQLKVMSPVGSDFPKVVKQKMEREMQDPRCCGSCSQNKKCWRHYLNGVVRRPMGRADRWICEDNLEKESALALHKETWLVLMWE